MALIDESYPLLMSTEMDNIFLKYIPQTDLFEGL